MLPLNLYRGTEARLTILSRAGKIRAEVGPTILRIVLIVFAFLILVSLWGFYISIRPPKIVSSITPRDLNMAYEHVSFKTADGLTLRGWYVPSEKKAGKTVILLHGYPADKGNILPAWHFCTRISTYSCSTSAISEKARGVIPPPELKRSRISWRPFDFSKRRGITEVGVWGFSMGGAVALMAIEKAPEIRAVISESSYASLTEMALQLFRFPCSIIPWPI